MEKFSLEHIYILKPQKQFGCHGPKLRRSDSNHSTSPLFYLLNKKNRQWCLIRNWGLSFIHCTRIGNIRSLQGIKQWKSSLEESNFAEYLPPWVGEMRLHRVLGFYEVWIRGGCIWGQINFFLGVVCVCVGCCVVWGFVHWRFTHQVKILLKRSVQGLFLPIHNTHTHLCTFLHTYIHTYINTYSRNKDDKDDVMMMLLVTIIMVVMMRITNPGPYLV